MDAKLTLSPTDHAALVEAGLYIGQYDLVSQTDDFVLEAQVQAGRLSEPLRRALFDFRRFGHPSGGLLIRNVPLGIVPTTPTQANMATGTKQSAAAAMSVILACLGDQYGFRPELGGNIIQDILPVQDFHDDEISVGSAVNLRFHVEMAFSEFRCDYVALLCIREDHEHRAGTVLSSIDAMLPLLSKKSIEVLRQPRFRTKVDRSFLIGDNLTDDIWIDPIQILSGPPRRPRLRVDFAETEGKDPVAHETLEALEEAANTTAIAVRLAAGDLLIVDNNRAVHGRTPFAPRYDGHDRWLLRSFVTKDLRRSEEYRPKDDRIIEPDYDVPPNRDK